MDEHLLARVARRDQTAFAEFYDRHAGRVLAMLRRILRDNALADDALQETFWQVWRQAHRFDAGRASAIGWLAMLARSRAVDLARQQRRDSKPAVAETWDEGGHWSRRDADSQSAPVEAAETADVLETALACLPVEQRSAIYLAFFCGLTQEQIAQQTASALGTVKTRIRRGIHRLREDLASRRRALA